MRKLLLFIISAIALAGSTSASDQLAFDVKEKADATIYDLQLKQNNTVKTIWSRRVELIDGKKPYDWCKLIEWAQNEKGIIAFVEFNEMSGKLLQFDADGELIVVIDPVGNWLQDIRRGGSLKMTPPDKIDFISPDGKTSKFMIHEDHLVDEQGKAVDRPEPLQIEKQTSVVSEQDQRSNDTVTTSDSNNSASTDATDGSPKSTDPSNGATSLPFNWIWAVVAILVVIGLLWLMLKKSK